MLQALKLVCIVNLYAKLICISPIFPLFIFLLHFITAHCRRSFTLCIFLHEPYDGYGLHVYIHMHGMYFSMDNCILSLFLLHFFNFSFYVSYPSYTFALSPARLSRLVQGRSEMSECLLSCCQCLCLWQKCTFSSPYAAY